MARNKTPRAKSPAAHDSDDDTPILEWIAGLIGLILFAGAIIITLQNGFSEKDPPVIMIQADAPTPVQGGFRVEFDVTNSGDQTAAAVSIVASLSSTGQIVEIHDVSIDFLPPHSSARAGVFLKRDPTGLDLSIAASSYQRP